MTDEVFQLDPYDEAEILASQLAIDRERGEFDSIEAVGIRARLGELVLTGAITEDDLRTILLNS